MSLKTKHPVSVQELIHSTVESYRSRWADPDNMRHLEIELSSVTAVTLLLNHQHKDNYVCTAKLDASRLEPFKYTTVTPSKAAPQMCRLVDHYDPPSSVHEGPKIWPRSYHRNHVIEVDARFADIRIAPPGRKPVEAHMWSVFIPARRAEGDAVYVMLSYHRDDQEVIERFLRDVKALHTQSSASMKGIIVYGGRNITLHEKYSWDDLVLTPEILASVKDDIEFWMASEDLYRRKRIPYRRGYLFEGPPGNGKTAVARVILSEYDFAAVSFNFSNPRLTDEQLVEAFEHAAEQAPAVFLLEDIDRVFQPDSRSRHAFVTREGLFNCLDGVATRPGLVVIATANHPELLDKAIRHRPGRFDVPVRFDNPGFDQRQRYIRFLLGPDNEHSVSDVVLAKVAKRCAGKSMAFIKLVYETAASIVFKEARGLDISDSVLQQAAEQALRYYAQMETPDDRCAGFQQDSKRKTEEKETSIEHLFKEEEQDPHVGVGEIIRRGTDPIIE